MKVYDLKLIGLPAKTVIGIRHYSKSPVKQEDIEAAIGSIMNDIMNRYLSVGLIPTVDDWVLSKRHTLNDDYVEDDIAISILLDVHIIQKANDVPTAVKQADTMLRKILTDAHFVVIERFKDYKVLDDAAPI